MAKIPLLSTRPILFWRCFMKHTTPFFYSSFACTASNCSDSCCIGWEIDIDQKTASYYHTFSQKEDFPFGKRLKEEISYEDIPHFILTPNERCPFLNHQNISILEKNICVKSAPSIPDFTNGLATIRKVVSVFAVKRQHAFFFLLLNP